MLTDMAQILLLGNILKTVAWCTLHGCKISEEIRLNLNEIVVEYG
jgi:hypothetical protein